MNRLCPAKRTQVLAALWRAILNIGIQLATGKDPVDADLAGLFERMKKQH